MNAMRTENLLCVLLTGYRHVYLEGMEEASIFVHVAINDITGKVTLFMLDLLTLVNAFKNENIFNSIVFT